MNRHFHAAILERSRSALVVDQVQGPECLQPGQVLVRVQYSGICGAQLNEIDAVKGPDKFLPHLLGHEGIADVIEVGPLVKTVQPGDRVVLHWMPGAGVQSDPPAYMWHGSRLNAGWVTSLNEFAVISENRCTRVESSLDPCYLPLFGCAATTASGVVGNDAHLKMGESVVVIGTGGVGLLCIEASRVSGGYPIVGVDRVAERLESASQMGATSVIDVNLVSDVHSAVIQGLGGAAPDVVIETTGSREMIEVAYGLVSSGGRCVLVGVPRHDEPVTLDSLPLHFDTELTGSKGGGTNPSRDIPRLVRLSEAGIFRLREIPITLLSLEDVNEGLDMIRNGIPGRIVIDMTSVLR